MFLDGFWSYFLYFLLSRAIYYLLIDKELCQRLPLWDDVPVLMELLVAALYSRAAYGFTGRRGLFDSVAQGGNMQKITQYYIKK